jgi:hypothetical protein
MNNEDKTETENKTENETENETENIMIKESVNNLVNSDDTNNIEPPIDKLENIEQTPLLENNKERSIKRTASNEEQMEALKLHLKKNWIFYSVVFLACVAFTKYDTKEEDSIFTKLFYLSKLMTTFNICMMCGHSIHWFSHNISTMDYLDSCDNLLTRNKCLNYIARFMCNVMDFHSVTHHDSSINKQFKNVVLEILNNFLIQSVFAVWFIQNVLNFKMVMVWGILYATLHNINYYFIKPSIHKDHHTKPTTNYGIDITDILFNTKYDWNDIENYNHYSINIIITTLLFIYFKVR